MSVKLNEYAILMSHDAATGYMQRDHVVADWAITQSVDLIGQLDCGARSFDYRPYYYNGTLFAHHGNRINVIILIMSSNCLIFIGGVKVPHLMSNSLDEVMSWGAANPSEFVMFYISACDGDGGCMDASKSLVLSKNMYAITDCSELTSLTVEEVYSRSLLANGGHVFALFDCVSEEYDPSIECYHADYTCYDSWPENTSQIPWVS